MTSVNIKIGSNVTWIGTFAIQVVLWVIHYGHFISLPWWIVWSPALLSGVLMVIGLILLIPTLYWGLK